LSKSSIKTLFLAEKPLENPLGVVFLPPMMAKKPLEGTTSPSIPVQVSSSSLLMVTPVSLIGKSLPLYSSKRSTARLSATARKQKHQYAKNLYRQAVTISSATSRNMLATAARTEARAAAEARAWLL
jgi:hypothetical protein